MTQTLTQPLASASDAAAADVADVVIKCAGLTKIFKDFWMRNRVRAVDGIDFEVRRGEVFGLLGPNGSGKSTTIKMILGLLNPTAGRIAVFGRPPSDVSIKKRIGYLPEESYLYRFLNARETLDYYGRLFHQNHQQRRQRIDTLLEMVGLDRVARRPVGEYSKGMQRRIGLAQALINDPDLLILDEPTTGLDPIGTRQVKDLIIDLAKPRNGKPGKTILLCSHLLSDVEDVCDRVAIMFGGKVRRYGTVDQLLVREDSTMIQAPSLSPELIQQIEELLERHGRHIERVEHPRQKLESLFLDIVNSAVAEGALTSGATSGGRIAEFLTGGHEEPIEGDQVIESLLSSPGEAKPNLSEPDLNESASEGPDETSAPAQTSVDADQSVLEQLQTIGAAGDVPGGERNPSQSEPTRSSDRTTGPEAQRAPAEVEPSGPSSSRTPPQDRLEDEHPDTDVLESLLHPDSPKKKE